MAKLIDQRTGEERELVKPVILIGRAPYCDICVLDRIVSREHARIRRRLTGYYIEDLGSTHGTRVNNVRIRKRAKLHDGAVITIAGVPPRGRSSSTPHPPHTDTAISMHKTPVPGGETAAEEGARCGASFIFRR